MQTGALGVPGESLRSVSLQIMWLLSREPLLFTTILFFFQPFHSPPPPPPPHLFTSVVLFIFTLAVPFILCLSCRSDLKVISQGRTKAAEKRYRPCCFGWPGLEEVFHCIMLIWLGLLFKYIYTCKRKKIQISLHEIYDV